MASDKAIAIRDRLNRMIDELLQDKDNQESNILACCIAFSVEEVEKWMYNGEFTPSVAPYREGKNTVRVNKPDKVLPGDDHETPVDFWPLAITAVRPAKAITPIISGVPVAPKDMPTLKKITDRKRERDRNIERVLERERERVRERRRRGYDG